MQGTIQARDAQEILDGCIQTLDPFFCDAVNRLPSGTIVDIAGVLENIAGIETSGVDINLDMSLAETGIGQFRFQWLTSLLLEYDELFVNTSGGINRVDRKGTEQGSPTRGFVETKSTLNTLWSRGDWSSVLSLRYLSSLTEPCAGLVADFGFQNLCSTPTTNTLDSVLYTDVQVSWAPQDLFGGGWRFSLGVNNLFDEAPPICFTCDLNSYDGTIYPLAGQFWYLRASFEN
jgi:iron complex outermembrane receptor protein